MVNLEREVAQLTQQLTAERVRALKRIIPKADVQAVLRAPGQHRRRCRCLPPWFMVWFVIALGLFCRACYRQVFKGLQPFRRKGTPRRSTLCAARRRLGVAPLRLLAERVAQCQATPQTPGAFYRGLRLMSLDSFVVNVPASPANARACGRPGSGRTPAAFPQVRVLARCETGTPIRYRTALSPCHRGLVSRAAYLRRFLPEDMLLLGDRNFLSYALVRQVRERRAHLLARIKKKLVFQPRRRLADGSYLAQLYPSPAHRRRDEGGLLVRVIAYTFEGPGRAGSGQQHRLLTTLWDAHRHPAKRLLVLYHERWEEELVSDAFKTHPCARPVLRSQTPAGVVQEVYGLLLGHSRVRRLMLAAAPAAALSPRRLSFTAALKILRCRLPECPKDRRGLRRW